MWILIPRVSRAARDHWDSREMLPRGSRERSLFPARFARVRAHEKCGSRTLAGPAAAVFPRAGPARFTLAPGPARPAGPASPADPAREPHTWFGPGRFPRAPHAPARMVPRVPARAGLHSPTRFDKAPGRDDSTIVGIFASQIRSRQNQGITPGSLIILAFCPMLLRRDFHQFLIFTGVIQGMKGLVLNAWGKRAGTCGANAEDLLIEPMHRRFRQPRVNHAGPWWRRGRR